MATKNNYPVYVQCSADSIAQKIAHELSAMDYNTCVSGNDSCSVVEIKKDTGLIDAFLGRWQCFDIRVSILPAEDKLNIEALISGRDIADKLLCAAVGLFTFAIPWIFGLIARSNRRNAEQVAQKMIGDFAAKLNNEYAEAHDEM